MQIRALLSDTRLLPELRLNDAHVALPLVGALLAAGIGALAISLRSPAGLAGIEAVRAALPQACIGASGLNRPVDVAAAGRLGVNFGSSAGYTAEIGTAARGARFPLLPGVMTPSDGAKVAGFRDMKFFPALRPGGAKFIQLVAAEFPDERFVVTGPANPQEAADYLRVDHVLCTTAPWLTPGPLVKSGRWAEIESLARDALFRHAARAGDAT